MSSMEDAVLAAKKVQEQNQSQSKKIRPRKEYGNRLIDTKKQITNIYKVLTNEVGLWEQHDRDPQWFNAENCADLLSDLPGDYSPEWENWQELPGLVRVIPEGKYPQGHKLSGKKYEVIYGGRRHWVCKHKGVKYFEAKVVAEKDGYDDKHCLALMHRENAKRKDILKMERAKSIHKAYRDYWQDESSNSLRSMAEMYNEPLTTIADYERAGRLFFMIDVNSIFKEVRKLPISAAKKLVSTYENDKELIVKIISKFQPSYLNSTADSKIVKKILDLVKAGQIQIDGLFEKNGINFRVDDIGIVKASINDKGEVTLKLPAAAHKINKKRFAEIVNTALEDLGVR